MKIGIGLPNQVPNMDPQVIPEWARSAESAGFSTLGSIGRIAFPGVMDTVALAAAAAVTSRIELLPVVLLAPVWPSVLLAKETASIDGISGGRLSLGLGLGARDDDYVVEGHPVKGRGKRFDRDIETYKRVWKGETVAGMQMPAVPAGTREVPILFGGFAQKTFERVAKWGDGYIAAAVPPSMAAQGYEGARAAWKEAGRDGGPRLAAITYYGLTDADAARSGIRTYYSFLGDTADAIAGGVHTTPEAVKDAAKAFEDIGTEEFVLVPGTDDPDEVKRLAEVLL